MDLTALLAYTRILADEIEEAPEGLFDNAGLTIVLNVAKDRVYLQLVDHLPQRFRKSVLIDLVAGQQEYSLVEDLETEDLMAVEVIVRNIAGKRPWPLIEITPEQSHQFMENPSYSDAYPRAWRWAEEGVLAFEPIPSGSLASALKMFYFKEIPDLEEDGDAPELPRLAHPLVALDALRQWGIRSAESQAAVDARYNEMFDDVVRKLALKSALRGGQLPGTTEMSGYGEDIVES